MYLIQNIKLFHLFGITNSIVFLTFLALFHVCFGVDECSFGVGLGCGGDVVGEGMDGWVGGWGWGKLTGVMY